MADCREGLVISHLGKGLAVESGGETILCHTRRHLGMAAVGDRVEWEASTPGQGRVMEILPRRTLLMRPARNGRSRPVAANLDQVFIVFATQPPCDFLLIDQYLAVCENHNLSAGLVFNKIDLASGRERNAIEEELANYRRLDYPVFYVSARVGLGIDELKRALADKTSIFTGQTGVGKSSLTNALIPDKQLKTNTLSAASGHGRHTTTAATLYHIPGGGDLIDSPGVAIFGLAGLSESQLANGFREFRPLIERCLFNDCRHVQDKGCAVRAAAEREEISERRYRRFLKLREKMPLDR
ncbi:MAG: ribosome small subunit-dependent GTPase A [Gammaproteobacteria bacterium]